MGPAQLAGVLVDRRAGGGRGARARRTTRRPTPGCAPSSSSRRGAEPAVLPVRDAVRRRGDRPARHPHRARHLPVRHRERPDPRAPSRLRRLPDVTRSITDELARRQPRRDRPPGLRDLPRPRHRDRRGALRRGRRAAVRARGRRRRTAARATRRPTPTCAATCSSTRPRRRRAPTRSTPATASCPRTPTSPAPVIDAGLTWVGPPPESIERWAPRSRPRS